jgi:hypothetical protein
MTYMTRSMTGTAPGRNAGIAAAAPARRTARLLTFPSATSLGPAADGPRQGHGPAHMLAMPRLVVPAVEHEPRRIPVAPAPQTSMPGESLPAAPAQGTSSPVLAAMRACLGGLRAASGLGVTVHVSAESGLPALALDDRSLEKVLRHMVKNAAEAMPDGGAVHIVARRALSRTHPAVLLHVSDDGCGIPAYALEHIFKPGFSSKRAARGWGERCGLGLAVVRDLVQGVGGTVEVASTRRRGTTFELRIPCAPPRDALTRAQV